MPYRQWTPDEAVEQLRSKGYGADAAQTMVRAHLDAGTARYGEPHGGWRVDEYDLAEIERKAIEQAPANLAAAVLAVVADYRDGQGNVEAGLLEAIASTRSELDHDDVAALTDPTHGEPLMDEPTAAAYRAVLSADQQALEAAMQDAAQAVGEIDVEASLCAGSGSVITAPQSSAAGASDASSRPPWMGGPAGAPRGDVPAGGRQEGYDGPYASHGRFAEVLDNVRVTGDPGDYTFGSASDEADGPLDPGLACAIAAAAAAAAARRDLSSNERHAPQTERTSDSSSFAET